MKKYVKSVFVAAIVAVAGYNMYQSQSAMNGMSELALANVEALATPEIDIPYICAGELPLCYDDYYNYFFDGLKQY